MIPLSELAAVLIWVLRDWISLLLSSALQLSPDALPLPLEPVLPPEELEVRVSVGAAQVGVAPDSSANIAIARTKLNLPKAISVWILFEQFSNLLLCESIL